MTGKGKKFVASYSGGKDSALALYRALKAGMEPVAMITTYNTNMGRSWFHGIPSQLLQAVSDSLGIPIALIPTDGSDYEERFREELKRLRREKGAEACVFGDIDIPAHLQWGLDICEQSGLEACFPLWQEARKDLVREFVDSGFRATITVVDTARLSERHLGMVLTPEAMVSIEAEGADVCGENGEYHTFVSDGPDFSRPVAFRFGEKQMRGQYAVLPLLPEETE